MDNDTHLLSLNFRPFLFISAQICEYGEYRTQSGGEHLSVCMHLARTPKHILSFKGLKNECQKICSLFSGHLGSV